MSRYPEWFVGGPWHGRDKMIVCPNLQGSVRVASVPHVRYEISALPSPEIIDAPDYFTYVPKRFSLFGHVLTVWVGEGDAGQLNRGGTSSREHEISRLLGTLLLAPHKIEERSEQGQLYASAMGDAAAPDREVWEIRRTLRDEIAQEFRAQDQRSQDQIRRLQEHVYALTSGQQTGREWTPLSSQSGAAGRIEIVAEGDQCAASFGNVTIYLDEGDSEQGPSWVATAQGTDGPVTGYGTTAKAAIVAMLADALDIYARMIDTSEKPRMR